MDDKLEKIPPFEYLKGEKFTEMLKEATGCKTLSEMSNMFGVPKATFSAWNLHDRTSHELMVRLHLAKGIPIEDLALSEAEKSKRPIPTKSVVSMTQDAEQRQQSVLVLKSYCLSNGKLVDTGEIPYAKRMFNSWDLNEFTTIEIETNEGRYLVDQSQNDAVSGEYLIDMNGRLSLNHIQRLPNKLAVVFGDTTVEVSEEDIRVIGRVAVNLNKK